MDTYVGNLPDWATVNDLTTFFGGYARYAQVTIVTVRLADGSVRRYGLARFRREDKCGRAIRRLHCRRLGARTVEVREFHHRTCENERRALDWRQRTWNGPERRLGERRRTRGTTKRQQPTRVQ